MAKKNYNLNLISSLICYTINDITHLFSITETTVRIWIKKGLPTIDGRKPHMIHGKDLKLFLKKKLNNRRHKCAPEQFFCFKCQTTRTPEDNTVFAKELSSTKWLLSAFCSKCGTTIYKASSVKQLSNYDKIFLLHK